jgi:hypothetical protein
MEDQLCDKHAEEVSLHEEHDLIVNHMDEEEGQLFHESI